MIDLKGVVTEVKDSLRSLAAFLCGMALLGCAIAAFAYCGWLVWNGQDGGRAFAFWLVGVIHIFLVAVVT